MTDTLKLQRRLLRVVANLRKVSNPTLDLSAADPASPRSKGKPPTLNLPMMEASSLLDKALKAQDARQVKRFIMQAQQIIEEAMEL